MIPKDQKGYTVAELLIAISVSVMAVIALSNMVITMYRQLQISRVSSELNNESQLLLRTVVEDTRLAGGLLTSNSIVDPYAPGGGWATNDPSNVLIIASPAVDSSANVIYDSNTNFPYKNEIIYFGEGSKLKRRILKNENAVNNIAVTTCPVANNTCKEDREFSSNLKDISFTFYDENDLTTANATNARSVNFTVTLEKKVSGKLISITNTMRTTLRNR